MPAPPKRPIEEDRAAAVQAAWRRERPDIDVSSIGILTRVMAISRHLARERERALRELGTDTPTLEVLAALRRAGAPYRLRTRQIEQATSVTAGATSQRLDRLEARGLVRRERDQEDRRVVHVRLTTKGRRLIDRIVAGLLEREGRLLDPLTNAQRHGLEGVLVRWLAWLEEAH